MVCIREPEFAVLVNGSPTQWFRSTTRLRQGDPVSPYLFIIGAEVLVRKDKKAQNSGRMSGINIDNAGGQGVTVSLCR